MGGRQKEGELMGGGRRKVSLWVGGRKVSLWVGGRRVSLCVRGRRRVSLWMGVEGR